MSDTTPVVEAPPIEPAADRSSPAVAPMESRPAAQAEARHATAPAAASIGILLINLGTPESTC